MSRARAFLAFLATTLDQVPEYAFVPHGHFLYSDTHGLVCFDHVQPVLVLVTLRLARARQMTRHDQLSRRFPNFVWAHSYDNQFVQCTVCHPPAMYRQLLELRS
jgi:hypothetical protein